MSGLKYKEGDTVRIKSLDWYNENKSKSHGTVTCGCKYFDYGMREWCGKTMTILTAYQTCYIMREDGAKDLWTDEMIEGLVEETKPEPKFKVGDKIRLKYTLLNDIFGVIGYESEGYRITNISNGLTYFMSYSIEHCYELVEEEIGLVDNLSSRWVNEFELPDGYIFKDENGNEILTNKIILEKVNTLKIQSDNMETETHKGYYTTEPETTNKSKKVAWLTFGDNDFADKVELDLSNRELIQEDGKWFVVKKKSKYPETYEECCEIVQVGKEHTLEGEIIRKNNYKIAILESFQKLLICRDAYWKIAGEEMGLGKPWEPDYKNPDIDLYVIINSYNQVDKAQYGYGFPVRIFTFPTAEMRDAFYENFKELIEQCKAFL